MTEVVVGATASERAVSILTAYCMSRDHNLSHEKGEDVAGVAFFDLIDEILDMIVDSETEEKLGEACDLATRTIVNLLGIMESLLEELDVEPYDMIKELVQENIRREECR